MKAYRIVTYVVDMQNWGPGVILEELQRSRHISVDVGAIDEIDIGEWDDDHPLNSYETDTEAYFQEKLNDQSV